ncbi:MAG TPA: endonuclease/exonuclease/phosphatase family protein [Candidatus Coprenecus stercoravium]|uniref:Endonuclease/exonuclease/phosphatase family protein n=1 Tax=Candidatus Coprenecus stercoravium TaxID=2840735 RepID=A0A9D2GQH4_9BACT|nr:endonuclease/exonuclease/phosphatase family protein [Candidatus Coprenecus stercoravium]
MGKKKKRIFLSISFRVIATFFCILLLLSYVSVLIDPAVFPPAGFFGIYFIPVLIINILLFFTALFRWSSSVWIPVIAIAPSLLFAGSFLKIPVKSIPETERNGSIKILTYNVGGFRSGTGNPETNLRNVIALLEDENPQIVSMQEFRTSDTSSISKLFHDYPYIRKHFYRLRNGDFVGNVTLSRLPITEDGFLRFRGTTNMALYTDIDYGHDAFRLYNIHLESNNISLTSMIKELKGGYDEFSQEFTEIHEKVRKSSTKRGSQVRALLDNIPESGLPAVICGDVNDTPMSYCFRNLSKGRKDTFREAGSGFGATYRILWPLLRIDYVFVPESVRVSGHRTPRVRYSDHYPVIADIDITDSLNL